MPIKNPRLFRPEVGALRSCEGIDVSPRPELSAYGGAMQRDTLNFRLLDGLSAGISVCMHRYP